MAASKRIIEEPLKLLGEYRVEWCSPLQVREADRMKIAQRFSAG
jgi:hypothetical protein